MKFEKFLIFPFFLILFSSSFIPFSFSSVESEAKEAIQAGCRDGFTLVYKSVNNQFVCVPPSTAERWVELEMAEIISEFEQVETVFQTTPQYVPAPPPPPERTTSIDDSIVCREGYALVFRFVHRDTFCISHSTAASWERLGLAEIVSKESEQEFKQETPPIPVIEKSIRPELEAFAEEEETGFKIVENVKSVVTFTFRDGVEVNEFPLYSMTTDFISNDGSTFKVQGVVGDAPHLHKALDELYKNRLVINGLNAGFDYNYRFFDVNVDFIQDNEIFNSNVYYNCEILIYQTKTLNSKDYESYHSSKSGFVTVDEIEFTCGGINSKKSTTMSMHERTQTDYATEPLPYSFAEDVRTYVTFDFDTGIERIEFHGFEVNSGFGEIDDAGPSFSVEHILQYYPLLENAIDIARKSSGVNTTYNIDFDVKVEFTNTEKVLRELDYSDCRVTGEEIVTLSDAEEGFTGKSGFVLVQRVDFICAGLSGNNSAYDILRGDVPVWDTSMMLNNSPIHPYNLGTGPTPMVTFTYADGIEVINFPIFEQQNVLDRSYPSFTLTGIVGDYPMLYEKVDENLSIQNAQGASFVELFDVDVDLMYGEKSVRGFNYSNCRVIDYDVSSAMRAEESYVKGIFALENIFEIECLGYTTNNPAYDKMFKTVKADNISTPDLRNTDLWGPLFTVQ